MSPTSVFLSRFWHVASLHSRIGDELGEGLFPGIHLDDLNSGYDFVHETHTFISTVRSLQPEPGR